MRIENPTFVLSNTAAGGEVMLPVSCPDVTQTAPEPTPAAPPSGDKQGLVEGAGAKEVYYLRGWRISYLRLWQVAAAVFLALFLIMVIVAALPRRTGGSAPVVPGPAPTTLPQVSDQRECESADCVNQAAEMIQLMNLEAKPCVDFFEYACGSFYSVAPASHFSRRTYSMSDWLQDKNENRVLELLLESETQRPPSSALWKLRNLHSSCLNDYANMKTAGRRMVQIINDIGGLDLIGTFNLTRWSFNETFRKVHSEHWTDAMMNFFWVRNPQQPDTNMLRITKSGTGIPYISAYLHPTATPYKKMMLAYRTTMATVMSMLVRDSGVNVTGLNLTCGDHCLQQFTDDVLLIETKLANISAVRVPRYSSFYGPRRRRALRLKRLRAPPPPVRLALGALQQQSPQIDWIALFDDLMGEGLISVSTLVEIPRGRYIQELGEMIDSDSKRALHHYLVWCVVRRHLMGMSTDYVFQKLQLDEVLRRARKRETRQEYCLSILDMHMPEAMGQLFVRDHIGMHAVRQMANFSESMVRAFSASFQPWMTDAVRYQADSILSNITFHYGFPKWIMDERELDEYFRPLKVISDNFFQNMKNIDLFQRFILRDRLQYGNSRQRWTIDASHAEILSSQSGRYLAVPAGMMQAPLFSPDLPSYVNTAAVGSLLAEHLSLFTVTNNESQILDRVWWDSPTNGLYQPYRSCLLDLYRNHTLSPDTPFVADRQQIPLRPEMAAASIVSRHYGLEVAFAEHLRLRELNGQTVRLPGLRHETSDQTFLLAFAQARCATRRSPSVDFLLHRLAGVIPVQLEVNTAVYNSARFRAAYKCPPLPAAYAHEPCLIHPLMQSETSAGLSSKLQG